MEELVIIPRKDLPKRIMLFRYFKEAAGYTTDFIKLLVSKQCPKIPAMGWKEIVRSTRGDYTEIGFLMDDNSVSQI